MKFFKLFKNSFRVKLSVKKEVIDKLVSVSAPDGDFLVLLLLSVLIITVGLILDNIFLLIGGMMVTPLLFPILAAGLGIAMLDWELLSRSLVSFIVSCLVSVTASYILARFFFSITEVSTSMIKNIQPRPLTLQLPY